MFSSGGTETGSVSLRQPAQNVCGHIRSIQKFLTISVNGRYQYLRFPDQESTDANTELYRPRHIAGRSRNIPVPWIVQTRVIIYPDMPRQSVLRDDFLRFPIRRIPAPCRIPVPIANGTGIPFPPEIRRIVLSQCLIHRPPGRYPLYPSCMIQFPERYRFPPLKNRCLDPVGVRATRRDSGGNDQLERMSQNGTIDPIGNDIQNRLPDRHPTCHIHLSFHIKIRPHVFWRKYGPEEMLPVTY